MYFDILDILYYDDILYHDIGHICSQSFIIIRIAYGQANDSLC